MQQTIKQIPDVFVLGHNKFRASCLSPGRSPFFLFLFPPSSLYGERRVGALNEEPRDVGFNAY